MVNGLVDSAQSIFEFIAGAQIFFVTAEVLLLLPGVSLGLNESPDYQILMNRSSTLLSVEK
jgi:hypothetical protein